MMIVQDADDGCEYFSGGYGEWEHMLLELLDHPVHEELAEGWNQWRGNQLDGEGGMVNHILGEADNPPPDYHGD